MLFSIEDNYNNYDNFFFNTNSHKFAVNFTSYHITQLLLFLLSVLFSIEDNHNNYDNFFFNTNVQKLAVNYS